MTALLTSYNYGDYVGEAVESALTQERGDRLEVVVVDDGSTDHSLAVLREFGDRIRLLRQENQGQLLAFRTGLAASRGELVCLLDADDVWLPGKVRAVEAAFADTDAEWVAHALRVRRDGTEGPGGLMRPLGGSGRIPGDPVLFVERRAGQATSGLAFRASLVRRLVPLIDRLAGTMGDALRQDADRVLMVLAGLEGAPGYHIREPLGVYRIHGKQKFAGGAQIPMLERQLEVDRLVADLTAALGRPFSPTPLYRHELVLRALKGEGGRLSVFAQGLRRAGRLAPRRPLLALRQAASLAYAFAAPRSWFRRRFAKDGDSAT